MAGMKCLIIGLLSLFQLSLAQYNYVEALEKSILFYEAQRSGNLDENSNRIPWRGDSALDDLIPQGYYDAGDHVKFGFPLAFTLTALAMGGVNYQTGYETAGQLEYFRQSLKWGTDYLIQAHTEKYVFYGQVGDGDIDHSFWGRPEEMTMPRPAFAIDTQTPGSELAAESAAALAAASIFYTNIGENDLAATSLSHARELFEFADVYRGTYTDAMPSDSYYGSYSGYGDELTWAACWLFKATNEQAFAQRAEELFVEFNLNYASHQGLGWENKVFGAHVLLYDITRNQQYENLVREEINYYLYSAPKTPKGLMFLGEWGSIRSSLNTCLALLHAADLGLMTTEIRNFVRGQLGYALGDTGRSFVVGFGTNPPQQPHHRGASCPDTPATCGQAELENPGPNPQVLYGALVGGPYQDDSYEDDRSDYVRNEVALDYNAGFQGVLAAVIQLGL